LWNVYSFFTNYASIDNFHPDQVPQGWKPENELDRWVLSELNVLVEQVDGYMDDYNPTDSGRRLQEFIDQLSNWYVRRSRRRFWKSENDTDKLSAYATLYRCLVTVSRLMAPLAPFMADELYQNLVCSADSAAPDSVHLDSYPVPNHSFIDRELMEATRLAMQVSSMGRAARSRAGVKVRQPLAEVKVWGQAKYLRQVQSQILEELNIKQLTVIENFEGEAQGYYDQVQEATEARNKGEFSGHGIHQVEDYWVSVEPGCLVAIDTRVSPELADEGLARELAHRIQGLRRNANFELTDRIATYYEGPEEIARVMGSHADYISQETLSDQLIAGSLVDAEGSETQKIEGMEVTLAVKRL
jgi:isoleucyl-tRNA synthetase